MGICRNQKAAILKSQIATKGLHGSSQHYTVAQYRTIYNKIIMKPLDNIYVLQSFLQL